MFSCVTLRSLRFSSSPQFLSLEFLSTFPNTVEESNAFLLPRSVKIPSSSSNSSIYSDETLLLKSSSTFYCFCTPPKSNCIVRPAPLLIGLSFLTSPRWVIPYRSSSEASCSGAKLAPSTFKLCRSKPSASFYCVWPVRIYFCVSSPLEPASL